MSTTCSTPAGILARSTWRAYPRCDTSPPSPCSHRIRPPGTASTRIRRSCWVNSRGATFTTPACRRPTASTTAAGCSSTTTRTIESRGSTFAISRRSRSSVRFPNSSGTHGSSFITENSRVRARRDAVFGAAAEGTLRVSVELRGRVQRDGQWPQGRSEGRDAFRRLAGADTAVQLGSWLDRQGARAPAGRSGRPTTPKWPAARWRRPRRRASATTRRSSTGERLSRR